MRIAQIVPPNASLYERKSQRIDAASLGEQAQLLELAERRPGFSPAGGVSTGLAGLKPGLRFDLAHVYAPRAYITRDTRPRRWWQRRGAQHFVSPPELPEAVEEEFFTVRASGMMVGSILRPSVKNAIEQAMHRLGRTREDVEWEIFETLPSPAEIARIGVWVDPAVDENDFDGGTAEALVAGCIVIASRTPINRHRCEEGRTAFLVPANDPNEMTHAILSALFKPEPGQQRSAAARQTIGKFRARQRTRVLLSIYETLLK
jgi:hypothetical protein